MTAITYPKLKSVTALDGFKLELSYLNGETRLYDFNHNLTHSFYKELTNHQLFKNVQVIDGAIFWPTGQDFCPHTLYEKSILLSN
jgi:hypothetical protein